MSHHRVFCVYRFPSLRHGTLSNKKIGHVFHYLKGLLTHAALGISPSGQPTLYHSEGSRPVSLPCAFTARASAVAAATPSCTYVSRAASVAHFRRGRGSRAQRRLGARAIWGEGLREAETRRPAGRFCLACRGVSLCYPRNRVNYCILY